MWGVGKMEKCGMEHSLGLMEKSMWGVGRMGNIGTEQDTTKVEK